MAGNGIGSAIGLGAGLGSSIAVGAEIIAPGVGTAIILGASIIGSLFKSGSPGPPPDARGFALTENPTNPTAPWLIIYGQPWYIPPLTTRYIAAGTLNTKQASEGDRLVKTFHTGAGPNDGRDLRFKIGGRTMFNVVDSSAPASKRTLEAVDASRKRFRFPAGDVVGASVIIYLDGVASYQSSSEAGDLTATSAVSTTTTSTNVKPRTIRTLGFGGTLKDSTLGWYTTRVGGLLPTSGVVDQDSVTLTMTTKAQLSVRWKSGGSHYGKTHTVPRKDIGFGVLDDGRRYFYVTVQHPSAGTLSNFTGFVISYTSKNGVSIVTEPGTGAALAVFDQAIASGVVVTATYKQAVDPEEFTHTFRTGERDQDPVSFDEGTNNTHQVGLELTQGTARSYSTSSECDDVIVGIEAPNGFYGTDSDGDPVRIKRNFQMWLKETAASDAKATTKNDPGTGWVQMSTPIADDGKQLFRLDDRKTGRVPWFFSVADLLAYTRTGIKDPTAKTWLPLTRYDVKVTATDAANAHWGHGAVDTDLYKSDLFFQTATEVRRIGLVLGNHSDLTIQYEKEGLDPNDTVEVRHAGNKAHQPATGAAVDGTTLLPVPASYSYSRNPVWLACHHITDKVAGAGHTYQWDHIDLASAVVAADYCDETVTLRSGDTETRAQCDIALGEGGTRRRLGDQIARILAGSEALAYWRSGKWHFLTDQDSAVVTDPTDSSDFTINEERDCLAGSVAMQMRGTEEIPTELHVTFRDAAKDDAPSSEQILVDDPQPSPRIVQTVEFPGVRRRSQANRVGTILLQQMRRNLRTITLQGTIGRGLRLLQLDPGDVVKFTSERLGITAAKYRVFSVGWTDGMRPALELVEHQGAAYSRGFQGANSATEPGIRKPLPDLEPPLTLQMLKVERIEEDVGV